MPPSAAWILDGLHVLTPIGDGTYRVYPREVLGKILGLVADWKWRPLGVLRDGEAVVMGELGRTECDGGGIIEVLVGHWPGHSAVVRLRMTRAHIPPGWSLDTD